MEATTDMALQTTTLANVKATFNQCLEDGEFIERFYEIVFETCPPLAYELEEADLMLRTETLKGAMEHVFAGKGMPAGPEENPLLNPNLWSFWVTSLIKAVSEVDIDFDTQSMRDWREVMFEDKK